MYSFESRSRGRLFHFLVGGCFVTALLLFGIAGMDGIAYPSLYQITGIGLMTAGTYLIVRYVLKIYRYEIAENGIISNEGELQYDLVITEITGKRLRVVTRVALRDITDIHVLALKKGTKEDVRRLTAGYKVYHYTNRPFEPVRCYIFMQDEGAFAVIPKDEIMLQYLRRFGAEIKESE